MKRILKSMNFYMSVVMFACLVAIAMPSVVKNQGIESATPDVVPSVSVLNIIRHADESYSVIMQDDITDGYNEEQIDSVLISLISEI